MRRGSRAAARDGELVPIAAAALAVVLLAPSCAPQREADPAARPELRLDAKRASPTFGAVVLGPLPRLGELGPADRARLEEELSNGSNTGAEALVVWTGTVELDPSAGGCVHPDRQPTVLGDLRLRGADLLFAPRIGFVPGVDYTACADLDAVARTLDTSESGSRTSTIVRLTFTPAEEAVAPPRVVSVWPTTPTVPENLLRIYVEFSEPMASRDVARHVQLQGEAGEVVPDAFVDVPHGLWDPRQIRLTLFLHPGRVKRGVGTHPELGPPLRAGKAFTLRIDGALASRRGVALGEPFEHRFVVGPADRSSPDPERWTVVAPRDAHAPVVVRFDEPLDRAQLLRLVAVARERESEPLRGSASVSADGTAWSFAPEGGWPPGSFRVIVARAVEDRAGNTVDRLFDVETPGVGTALAAGDVAFPGIAGDIELHFATPW